MAPEMIEAEAIANFEEEGPGICDFPEERGIFGQFNEKLLQDVMSIGFVPGQVEDEGEENRGVGLVKGFKIGGFAHAWGWL